MIFNTLPTLTFINKPGIQNLSGVEQPGVLGGLITA